MNCRKCLRSKEIGISYIESIKKVDLDGSEWRYLPRRLVLVEIAKHQWKRLEVSAIVTRKDIDQNDRWRDNGKHTTEKRQ